MTEIEARGKIKYRIANEMRKAGENKEEYEDLEIALQVMKELREYRELGTLEEVKNIVNLGKWGYKKGYNKAIDDLMGKVTEIDMSNADYKYLIQEVENLKRGVNNG